jgi:hypothetical protein
LLQILPYLQPGAQVLDTQREGGDDIGLLAVRLADARVALFFVNQREAAIDVQLEDGAGRVRLPGRSITTLASS